MVVVVVRGNQREDRNSGECTQSNESRGGARWWLAPLLSLDREDT